MAACFSLERRQSVAEAREGLAFTVGFFERRVAEVPAQRHADNVSIRQVAADAAVSSADRERRVVEAVFDASADAVDVTVDAVRFRTGEARAEVEAEVVRRENAIAQR